MSSPFAASLGTPIPQTLGPTPNSSRIKTEEQHSAPETTIRAHRFKKSCPFCWIGLFFVLPIEFKLTSDRNTVHSCLDTRHPPLSEKPYQRPQCGRNLLLSVRSRNVPRCPQNVLAALRYFGILGSGWFATETLVEHRTPQERKLVSQLHREFYQARATSPAASHGF